jgi:hypothetical protein
VLQIQVVDGVPPLGNVKKELLKAPLKDVVKALLGILINVLIATV